MISSFTNVSLLFRNVGVFAQDTWRIVPRLAFTYGVRWDLDSAPSSLNGPAIPSVTGYDLNDFSQLAIAPPGTSAFKTTYSNAAPRLGLAYELAQNQDWGTVLRGGFGVFYDLVSSETGNVLASVVPPFGAQKFFRGTFPFTPTQIAPAPIHRAAASHSCNAFNPNLKLPYTLEWNIALEQRSADTRPYPSRT